jgi:hypothetical protein
MFVGDGFSGLGLTVSPGVSGAVVFAGAPDTILVYIVLIGIDVLVGPEFEISGEFVLKRIWAIEP